MNLTAYKKTIRILSIAILFLFPAYLLFKLIFSPTGQQVEQQKAQYVGKENCKECHLQEYNDWIGSHHDLAMDVANDSTVLGDFSDVTIKGNGITHRLYKKDGRFYAYTDGPDGKMQSFEIKYVFGYTPLQQYLVEFDGGRLQTLPITWNTETHNWYHMADSLYKDQNIDTSNWLHWTNQAQTWNGMCAECHSTNVVKGYDPETDTYHTTYSEIDVSCEACHGPGSQHVEWANLPEYSRDQFENYGLQVKTSGITNGEYVNTCARCHSRKSTLQDYDHSAASIYDNMIPALPGEPSWYIDGQIKDEDYVYASFMQSKMFQRQREVQCNDCHNVHSGERLMDGNDLCLQCHQKEVYDSYNHHHHKQAGEPGEAVTSKLGIKYEVGSGTECINCHMAGQYYMGVDFRRDHSFRIPRPDLSIKNGTPNACTQCHADESNQWADQSIIKWYGTHRRFHYSEAFAEANEGLPEAATKLKTIIDNDLYPLNIRSRAVENLGINYPDSMESVLDDYLTNTEAGIRLSALRTIQIPSDKNIQRLLNALTDATKAVRTEAAQHLMQAGDRIPGKYQKTYQQALDEYKAILLYNADFPMGKFNLANFYYNQNQMKEAEKYYLAAINQDSELSFIKLNLAYLYNRTGQNDKAEQQFLDYLKKEPNDADALFSLGLLLAEMGKYDASLDALLSVRKLASGRPRVNHNIAMMYDFMKDKEQAEKYLKEEISVSDNLNSEMELLNFYLQNNYGEKALDYGLKILDKYPEAEQVRQIVDQLQAQIK
jgi:predicted CXXCH cytochrome family protein